MPVAYGARVTTPTERNYAPIEREALAICFGCEYFHQYIYGLKNVVVESDHKPLSALFKKSLKDNPPRIQNFRLRTMKYSITVRYVPGKDMWLSDALSRSAYNDKHLPKPDDQISRNSDLHINTIRDNLPLSIDKWAEIRISTDQDGQLVEVRTPMAAFSS